MFDESLPVIDRALLVFLRYPEPGRVKPSLAASIGATATAAISRVLAERTIHLAAALPDAVRYAFFDPPDAEEAVIDWLGTAGDEFALAAQMDGTLGERLSGAFRRIFSRNDTRKAIVIGSDCPALTTAILLDAFRALDTHDLVLGPAASGHYYLLGLKTHEPALFEHIPWGTDGVTTATLAIATRLGRSHHLLPPLRDIDRLEDLEAEMPDWRVTFQDTL